LKVNDEKSRIRIHTKMSWIRNTARHTETGERKKERQKGAKYTYLQKKSTRIESGQKETERTIESVGLKRNICLKVTEAEGVKVTEAEGVKVTEAEGVKVPEAEGVKVTEAEGVKVAEAEGVKVMLSLLSSAPRHRFS
jgi:hypothetical protein